MKKEKKSVKVLNLQAGKDMRTYIRQQAQDRKRETELQNYVGEKVGMDYESKRKSLLTQVDLVGSCVQMTPTLRYKMKEKIHLTEYLG